MSDLRDIGSLDPARFDDDQVVLYDFVRVEFPDDPPGVLRYVNKSGGANVNLDGDFEDWADLDVKVGPVQQGRDSALEVSWVEFPDSDGTNTWVGYLTDPGVQGVLCTIYRFHFNTSYGEEGSYILYEGEMDEARDLGTRVRVTLVPAGDRTQVPGRAFLASMDEFKLMPKPGDTITLPSGTVSLSSAPSGNQPPVIPYVPWSPDIFFF